MSALDNERLRFIRETRQHRMTIEQDEGVFRSVFFGKPGTNNYHFRLTTWPGHLAVSGDMGTYVFSRTHDMFGFFRERHGILSVSAQYWHEKMEAVDRRGRGAKEFSEAKFRAALKSDMDEWDVRLGDAEKIRAEVEDYLKWEEIPDARAANELLRDFESSAGHRFTDFWEHDLTEWNWSFLWILYAIVWGIKLYDQAKEGRTQADHDRRVLKGAL